MLLFLLPPAGVKASELCLFLCGDCLSLQGWFAVFTVMIFLGEQTGCTKGSYIKSYAAFAVLVRISLRRIYINLRHIYVNLTRIKSTHID